MMTSTDDGLVPTVNREAEKGRSDFYERARKENLAPLWRVLHGLVTATPQPKCVPVMWRYSDVRPYLTEASSIISTEEAERRVLVFENPGLPGQSRITQSLFGGLQTILPGEIAPAHRHTASALRFIIEGRNAYTSVGGERTMMEPGDFVITPSMAWHDHGNVGTEPMVWLDGLDMHIVNMLGASFREGYEGKVHPVDRPEGASIAEVGSNLAPIDINHQSQTSPIFNYTYARTREALLALAGCRKINEWHGHKMRYLNPLTGGWAMPTMSTTMQFMPRGFETRPYRSTDSTVFVVVEGEGTSQVGDQTFTWGPRDIFVVPSWVTVKHQAARDAFVFSYSDRVVQEKLDLFREEQL
jgi:gentisate 1,2-dioxygenase